MQGSAVPLCEPKTPAIRITKRCFVEANPGSLVLPSAKKAQLGEASRLQLQRPVTGAAITLAVCTPLDPQVKGTTCPLDCLVQTKQRCNQKPDIARRDGIQRAEDVKDHIAAAKAHIAAFVTSVARHADSLFPDINLDTVADEDRNEEDVGEDENDERKEGRRRQFAYTDARS
jgi:hypothetical protein